MSMCICRNYAFVGSSKLRSKTSQWLRWQWEQGCMPRAKDTMYKISRTLPFSMLSCAFVGLNEGMWRTWDCTCIMCGLQTQQSIHDYKIDRCLNLYALVCMSVWMCVFAFWRRMWRRKGWRRGWPLIAITVVYTKLTYWALLWVHRIIQSRSG